jgi:hypothetical protein
MMNIVKPWAAPLLVMCLMPVVAESRAQVKVVKVRMSWGHEAAVASPYYFKLVPATPGVEVRELKGESFETGDGGAGEGAEPGVWMSSAGAGDIDALTFTLVYPEAPAHRLQSLAASWASLIARSDADTAKRLTGDPGFSPKAPRLTVLMNQEGTRGFSFSVDQLLDHRALWIPALHVYLTLGEGGAPFTDHLKGLALWKGRRILDRVQSEPEASYEQYKERWEDMGSPHYTNPHQQGPGHIVCLTWDSAIAKFEIDRGAGVWNDLGNPDRFQFWFGFGDIAQGISRTFRGQRLKDGLPVITTTFEKDDMRYEVEQFAYPLNGPPRERRGEIAMVLLQRVKVTNLQNAARRIPITMAHRREFAPFIDSNIIAEHDGNRVVFLDSAYRRALLTIDGVEEDFAWHGTRENQRKSRRIDATVFMDMPARGSREFVIKLPSAPIEPRDRATLIAINFEAARATSLDYWSAYLARGAQFRVPEEAVNNLFRATLWHALRLPRRHGATGAGEVAIDLPYSNSAYGQAGTPWPVNHAVYVDYMLYDLRGYPDLSVEELLVQYRNNQEENGHINGYANWVVYTPGMLYTVAKHFLLTHDRETLDRLLPNSLKALDWCLQQLKDAGARRGPSRGLVAGPLNDGTGEGVWGFNQAYMYAGLNLFGQVLTEIGHTRAAETISAARALHEAIERGFGAASARSPLVQLRDHTWMPYVPGEATASGRLLDQWYPADVDTGPVHLLRLHALSPHSELADFLLHDHEDNLYLNGWGMADEPVYNQQATAYLLRDDPKAAIRAFYSYMASAFSHSVFEPVEHRWSQGQFFGPPSTSGAWFELYRHMLIRETDDQSLLLAQATPRKWLADGKKIEVERAPTYFDRISFTIESRASSGEILANIVLHGRRRPRTLILRLRHPGEKRMRAVTVNGVEWKDFDPQREWVRIENPTGEKYAVIAGY